MVITARIIYELIALNYMCIYTFYWRKIHINLHHNIYMLLFTSMHTETTRHVELMPINAQKTHSIH